MRLKKVTDRLYYYPHDENGDRPLLGYLRGDRFSVALDAGNSEKHVRAFYAELSECGLPLPSLTVITHWHWDHTFAMHAIAGLSVATRATDDALRNMSRWEWTDDAMRKRLQTGEEMDMCDACIRVEYGEALHVTVRRADMVIDGSVCVDLGGVSCTLIPTESPHCEGNLLMYVPAERALFMGDANCSDFYTNHGRYDARKFRALYDRMEALDYDVCLHGHCEPLTKREILADMRMDMASDDCVEPGDCI